MTCIVAVYATLQRKQELRDHYDPLAGSLLSCFRYLILEPSIAFSDDVTEELKRFSVFKSLCAFRTLRDVINEWNFYTDHIEAK